MKRQSFQLTIDKPCHQDWSDMTKTESGRYCSKCAKDVMNFSGLLDSEVIRLIERNPGPLCGNLNELQLNHTYNNIQPSGLWPVYKFLAGLMLASSAELVAAKGNHQPITEFRSLAEIPNNPAESQRDSITNVQGILLDAHSRESIPFTMILIKGTKAGTVTDADGKFNLDIPDSLVSDSMVLAIKSLGSDPVELDLKREDIQSHLEILISSKGCEIAITGVAPIREVRGAIAVVIVQEKKKKWWQFWK